MFGNKKLAHPIFTVIAVFFLNSKVVYCLPNRLAGSVSAFYNFAMEKNPVFLNCVQGGTVAACGDFVSQKLQAWTRYKQQESSGVETCVSCMRMLKASTTGIAFNGLLMPAYYVYVQKRWPSRSPLAVVLKTAADALVFGFFGNAATIAIRGRLEVPYPTAFENRPPPLPHPPAPLPPASACPIRFCWQGKRWGAAVEHARQSMGGVFRADFAVWTSYNFVCYGRIPVHLQPASTAVMSAAWSAYIACVATGPAAPA